MASQRLLLSLVGRGGVPILFEDAFKASPRFVLRLVGKGVLSFLTMILRGSYLFFKTCFKSLASFFEDVLKGSYDFCQGCRCSVKTVLDMLGE